MCGPPKPTSCNRNSIIFILELLIYKIKIYRSESAKYVNPHMHHLTTVHLVGLRLEELCACALARLRSSSCQKLNRTQEFMSGRIKSVAAITNSEEEEKKASPASFPAAA